MSDQIRIFSFVGSCAGERSHTKKASDMLAEAVSDKAAKAGLSVSYECMTGDQLRIEYCRSCTSCFRKGFCPLDEKDDMPLLRHKFLGADIIFFCTPVYLWEMSGMCKSVIDRITFWSHRMELAGKAAVTLACTDTSTGPDLEKRFKDLFSFTGAAVVNGITVRKYGPLNKPGSDELNALMEKTAQMLLEAADDPAPYITELQEQQYRNLAKSAMSMKKLKDRFGIMPADEARASIERGLHEYGTFAEYIRKVKETHDQ